MSTVPRLRPARGRRLVGVLLLLCLTTVLLPLAEAQGQQRPPCPANVTAIPQSNGSIRIDWSPVSGATAYRVYRAAATGPFILLAEVSASTTTYTDTTTAVGQTYRYRVTAVAGSLESTGCGSVAATAVPEFATLATAGLATVGAVGVFVALRRRRG